MPRKSSTSITITEVANQAGVSIATVSRHINKSGPVSDAVAERINQVMVDLKYIPNTAAQQLASQKTLVVGLLLHNLHNDFFGPLLFGIETQLKNEGYNLLVATHRANGESGTPLPIGPHNTDGLLVFADSVSDAELRSLNGYDHPVVLIHRTAPDGLSLPSVTVENKSATIALISHLIEVHGCQRIIFMRGPSGQEDSAWRESGYRKALENHGIDTDPDLILMGGFERSIAYQNMDAYLSDHDVQSFDAVFSGDDEAAVGVMDALAQHGYRVPEDVALVGFDDMRLATYINPALTTVRAPTYEVGLTAASKLIQLINKRVVESVTLLPTDIIIRRSCGCAP